MSHDRGVIGWDLGGAHLKIAVLDRDGALQQVAQLAMPLWQGIEQLDEAVGCLAEQWPLPAFDHVMTMTGELVDLFESRSQGVSALAERMAGLLPEGRLRLYAGPRAFVPASEAVRQQAFIASANWYATAAWLAQQIPQGLMMDLGSTTADLLPLSAGRVNNRGYSDRERLACDEMVYTGVVRTPVMAVVQRVPLAGEWLPLANEHFATMADVYRILDWLPASADQHATADGRDKSPRASMRRLARMLGADLSDAPAQDWVRLAAYVADRQLDTLSLAGQRVMSRGVPAGAPLIGAGVGRFLVARLARRLDRPYIDIDSCFGPPMAGGLSAGVCAPAVAVALLAQREVMACAC